MIRYEITPAGKRLDKIDEQDIQLERDRESGAIPIDEYVLAKHALTLKRNKEWATVCRAMGWPIEYNPLTRDPELMQKEPDPEPEPVEVETESPEARKRRHLHYKIFFCWVAVLLALYWLLSG